MNHSYSLQEIEAIHASWRDSEERLKRALELIAARSLMEAFSELRALVEADPGYALAHFHYSTVLLELNSLGPALKHAVAALELGLKQEGSLEHARALLAAWEEAGAEDASPVRERLEPLLLPREPTTTLAMIVKDEEANLERCLATARDVVSQIVVVDTGSTDRTVEIARGYGAEVHHFAWRDDFAAARNESLRYATGDWILWLDADEELLPESVAPLRDLLTNEEIGGAHLRIDNLMGGQTIPFLTTRLWRNHPTVRFKQPIHEQILWAIAPYCRRFGKRVVEAPEVGIRHTGYLPSVVAARGKATRNLEMLERLVTQEPTNDYALFHYTGALREHGQREKAIEVFTRWEMIVRKRGSQDDHWIRIGFANYVATLNELERHEEALNVAARAMAERGATVSLLYYRAFALHRLGRHTEALEDLETAGRIPRGVGATVESVDFQPLLVPMLTADVYLALGQKDQARESFQQAISFDPNDPTPRYSLARLCIAEDDLAGAAGQLDRILRTHPDDAQALATLAQIEVFQHRFGRAIGLLKRAVELDPSGETVRLLGEAFLFDGDDAAAERAWRIVESHESVVGCLAFLQLSDGKIDEGIRSLSDPKAETSFWALLDKIASLHRKGPLEVAERLLALTRGVATDRRLQTLRTKLVRLFLKERFVEGIQVLRSSPLP